MWVFTTKIQINWLVKECKPYFIINIEESTISTLVIFSEGIPEYPKKPTTISMTNLFEMIHVLDANEHPRPTFMRVKKENECVRRQQKFHSLPKQYMQTDSTFRAKAFRRELITLIRPKGLCSKRRICLYRLGSEYRTFAAFWCCYPLPTLTTYSSLLPTSVLPEGRNLIQLGDTVTLFVTGKEYGKFNVCEIHEYN